MKDRGKRIQQVRRQSSSLILRQLHGLRLKFAQGNHVRRWDKLANFAMGYCPEAAGQTRRLLRHHLSLRLEKRRMQSPHRIIHTRQWHQPGDAEA